MKSLWFILAVISMTCLSALASGCGYSHFANEVIGQPKTVLNVNPILCNQRADLDLSLGVMRNGVGSMSSHDEYFTIPDVANKELLERAVSNGSLVKITYDVKRWTWCWNPNIVRKVEVLPAN